MMRAWIRAPDARWLLAVFALALAVRLFVAVQVTPNPRDGRFDDSVWYDATARHLADGKGYVNDPTIWIAGNGDRVYPNESELTATAVWPPGYPLTLAAIYKVTGDSLTAGRLANVLFGSVTVALVSLIALRLFGRGAAIGAGIGLALMPSHVLFTAILLSETYFGFLLAALLAVCVYFVFGRNRASLPVIVGLGALVAFAGLVRGEITAFGGVIALLMIYEWRTRAALPLIALAAGALIILGPWTLRNQLSLGEPIVGTTGAGRVMVQGHNPEADGGPSLIAFGRLEADIVAANPGIGRQDIELKTNREGTRRAREWALDHKLREIELIGHRTYMLFQSDDAGVVWLQSNKPWFGPENADRLINLSTAYFWALAALMLASAPVWWRPRDARSLAVFAIVPFYMLVFGVLFIGAPRYHYAMYIPLAVFAGAGASALVRITVEQWRDLAGGPERRAMAPSGAGHE